MTAGRFVAYYRVSTQKQGQSGLGLDAQRVAVLDYLDGGDWTLAAEFTEVESGRKDDRPELANALAACRRLGATLVIAKLDRLARRVSFVSTLMDSGVEFVAVDFPQANRLTIHILAAVAEHEREMVSQRTKTALAAAKARGVKLGNANMTPAIQAKGAIAGLAARRAKAVARAADLVPLLDELRIAGATSLRALAAELNGRGVPAPGGGTWHANTVRRVLVAG